MKKNLEQLKNEKIILDGKIEKEINRVMLATGLTKEQIMKIVNERLGINTTVH